MNPPMLDQLRDCLSIVMKVDKQEVPVFSHWRKTDDGPPSWELSLAQWLAEQGVSLEVVTIHSPHAHWPPYKLSFEHIRMGTDHDGLECMALFFADLLLLDPARIDQSRYPQSYLLLHRR